MRFAILKAGTAYRGARERLGDFQGMFTRLLARPGQIWEVHDVEHGQFPTDPAQYSGYIITGGRASAYDKDPWVLQLLALVREIHALRIPLLGVCLGHQVVAQALGGRVAPNPKGWDLGVRELSATPAGQAHTVFRGAPQPLTVYEMHGDAVLEPPPGAVILASSPQTECEAFALGDHILAMQGHPEFDAEVVREAVTRLSAAQVVPVALADRALANLDIPIPQKFWAERLGKFLTREGAAAH